MTDQSTSENPDATPTQAIELTDQQPVAQDTPSTESAPESSAQEPEKTSGRHTRTVLEIIGAAAAVVLIAAAAAGGFAAGLAVSDDGPRGFAIEHMAEERQGGGDYGRGGMGRGHSDDQRFGKDRGFEGRGDMGGGFEGDGQDLGQGRGFGDGRMSEQMDEMLRQFMDEFGQGAGQEQSQG